MSLEEDKPLVVKPPATLAPASSTRESPNTMFLTVPIAEAYVCPRRFSRVVVMLAFAVTLLVGAAV